MLVLSRKPNESVVIGGDIEVTVVEVRGNHVKLALSAPDSVRILRAELAEADGRGAIRGQPAQSLPPRASSIAPAVQT